MKSKPAKKADQPIILVTNDDGITAPGIRALIEAVNPLGKVVVVAPESPQSAKGHAITIGIPLRLNQVHIFGEIEAYQCSGTPVDCVKLAKDKVLGKAPDICVSGINHGANHSINVIYSGTMSAAMEAAIEGIPSVGFSLLDYQFNADFNTAKTIAHQITERILRGELPGGALLNVNIPPMKTGQIKGIRICRQANAKWVEEFDERTDPTGKKYYWLTGEFKNLDKGDDTDVWALAHGYVSVVPITFDLTHYKLKQSMEKIWKINPQGWLS